MGKIVTKGKKGMTKKGAEVEFTEEFDVGLKKLEEIVEKLDFGELKLEESLSTFEDGMKLVKALTKKLDEAEKKIEILKDAGDGKIEVEDFNEDD